MNVQQFFVRALFLFFTHLKCFLVTSIDYKNTVFHHKADKRLSYASSVHNSRSAKDCVASCAVVANCLYVSYCFASAQCELSDKKPDSTTITLDVVSGWDVYVKALLTITHDRISSLLMTPDTRQASLPKAPYRVSVRDEVKLILGTDSCDFGWYPYNDSCYYLVQEPTDWETAKKACESLGAHLIDIQTEDEYRFITEHITADSVVGSYWIGANDFDQDGTFTWSDGSPVSVSFSAWSPGQPDNGGSSEYCVQMKTQFEWNDKQCTASSFWRICEK